ncbi:AAA family ATPase [Empedobacter sp. GD03644]|uniref:McrB family protein n=1 Tax=Empedobacter sp. GD03644 TaxID=2975358 RepID=UPI00244C1DB3|nr:AAA family ATPase [Empedobacter sp. GD03644]MDH2208593.1 AAA family ATPase [Empedobacter sp. GD03644]
MANTFLTRISKLEQYNSINKTVLWEDGIESRWTNVYGQLQLNDNAIFIAANKLLIGTVTQINPRQSILCSNIQEVFCSNDQFLQLHEIYPEQISRVKANFQPFIHPQQIDISKLISDANAKRFVSYYILANTEKYEELKPILKPNDRIVLINSNDTFDNIQLQSTTGLIPFQNVSISVQGLSLQEVLELNQAVKRKSKRSNNVTRVQEVIKTTSENGVYKFKTFFSYYDFLYNKLVYKNSPTISNSKIKLNTNETVFKVSMSGKDINEEAFNYLIENNLVIVHRDTPAKGTSYQTQGDTFANQMKIGDYFYLCRGNSNLEVIGRITSNIEECEFGDLGDDGWLQRSYEIVAEAEKEGSYQDEKKWWTPNDNSTCIVIPKNEIANANKKIFIPFFQTEFEYEKINPENITEIISNTNMASTLNQILFGPPGTGKTYNTINKAIGIANPSFDLSQSRSEIKKEFDRLMKEEQIVFTTFHQSMNYEDFIEGIKPIEPEKEGDPISYQIEYGIFRNLCIEASFAIAQLRENKTTEEVLDFSILYDTFAESVEEKLLKGEQVELDTKTGGTVLVDSISQKGNFVIKHHDGTRTYTVSKARLTKLQSAIKNLDDVSNINDQFREVIGGSNSSAYWSVLNAIRKEKRTQSTNKETRTYTFSDKKEVVSSLTKSDYVNKNGKPFVLIIDEINRGNVSQIFGELITLIEDDKRLGKDEALEVTLPYSKEKFGVPPNLFIIGTINTADRSVEALDTALRRRFSFEEMPPKPELIKQEGKLENGVLENIELDFLLNTINRRIEKLLDKDHQIGHSYFISVANFTDLKSVFKNKIVPLLQEYFFGDYGKIGLIIGKGFFDPIENDENIFADFSEYDASDFTERNIFRIKDIGKMDEIVFANALNALLNK